MVLFPYSELSSQLLRFFDGRQGWVLIFGDRAVAMRSMFLDKTSMMWSVRHPRPMQITYACFVALVLQLTCKSYGVCHKGPRWNCFPGDMTSTMDVRVAASQMISRQSLRKV